MSSKEAVARATSDSEWKEKSPNYRRTELEASRLLLAVSKKVLISLHKISGVIVEKSISQKPLGLPLPFSSPDIIVQPQGGWAYTSDSQVEMGVQTEVVDWFDWLSIGLFIIRLFIDF